MTNLGLLGQVLGMQDDEAGQSAAGLIGLVFGIIQDRLLELEVLVVGEVVGQHVLDEALLDGLAHRVEVEGMMLSVRTQVAEQLQGPTLGCGGEREERQVRLPTPGGHSLGQQRLGVGGVLIDLHPGRAKHFTQRFR